MGKNKNKGRIKGTGLVRKVFKCGHSCYTDEERVECPKCARIRRK